MNEIQSLPSSDNAGNLTERRLSIMRGQGGKTIHKQTQRAEFHDSEW